MHYFIKENHSNQNYFYENFIRKRHIRCGLYRKGPHSLPCTEVVRLLPFCFVFFFFFFKWDLSRYQPSLQQKGPLSFPHTRVVPRTTSVLFFFLRVISTLWPLPFLLNELYRPSIWKKQKKTNFSSSFPSSFPQTSPPNSMGKTKWKPKMSICSLTFSSLSYPWYRL